ncbi:hypothetical protein [Dictyobacter aurantiacus]|uniref:PAS fold-3 domain-containing protein n=1 Tax=Dictyobacter aurantiacus TaxID=1936993 RepID=A0A401ZJF1_9CHLR|nr:hypothetical protein [Dictyobacter aurantiacus]GCE06969.1 hypothetical protein KDAU_42980 [Dictyobacter aurantiacus]
MAYLHQQEPTANMDEAEVQLALRASGVGTWNWNLLTNEIIWTNQTRALFGLPSGTPITYELFLASLHPDDREMAHQINLQAIAACPSSTCCGQNVTLFYVWAQIATASRARFQASGDPSPVARSYPGPAR